MPRSALLSSSINSGRGDLGVPVTSLQRLIQGWLQHHISSTDLAFARYCSQEPSARSVQLPSPKELLDTGLQISDYEQVETVHCAGDITPGQIKARLR